MNRRELLYGLAGGVAACLVSRDARPRPYRPMESWEAECEYTTTASIPGKVRETMIRRGDVREYFYHYVDTEGNEHPLADYNNVVQPWMEPLFVRAGMA